MVAPAVLVLLLAACDAAVVKHKVTPVEKVIELLEKLKDGTAAEAQADAKTYDEFACFCKEQADNKLYAITKSKELIKQQAAKIKMLTADITALNGEIQDLTKNIAKLSKEQKAADETRAKEFDDYSEEESKVSQAISAVERAIKALEESKEGMVDAKLDLKQAKAKLSKRQFNEILALLELAAPGKPHAYEYRSNDIISTLKGLLKTFKQKKVDLDTEEAHTRNEYEMAKQARENTISFAEKDKAEKEALVATKEEDLEQTKQAKKEETDMMKSDEAFMKELTSTCETKAKDFDQRSETRVAEITAITKALEILRSGVQPNYGANKKLTGLLSTVVTADEPKSHLSQVKSHNDPDLITANDMVLPDGGDDQEGDVEFIQLRGAASKASKFPKAMAFLREKAAQLKSPVLSTLMTKIKLGFGSSIKSAFGKDHFVKVRGLIKDLISKLEADAESEASQKGFCDEEMGKAIEARDEAIGQVEEISALIDKAKSKIAELTEEIDVLGTEIAELRKGLFEATELRAAEKADNTKTIGDSEAGLEAVKGAIEVLKEFYDNAFIQTGFVPEGADRDGNTVADLAPAGQEGTYHGNQDAAKGIFGLLEVIQADFERTIDKTTTEEEDAQKEFEEYEEETKTSIKDKSKEKKDKEDEKEETEADLVQHQDDLKEHQKLLESAKEELEKLKPLCVDTGMDWKERRARQEQEIAALKEALAILSEI